MIKRGDIMREIESIDHDQSPLREKLDLTLEEVTEEKVKFQEASQSKEIIKLKINMRKFIIGIDIVRTQMNILRIMIRRIINT